MFDKKVFLSKIFGDSAYQVIEKSLNLIGVENFSVNNVKDYIYDSVTGNFELTKDVKLNYDTFQNDDTLIIISSSNCNICFEFKEGEDPKYFDYRELLEDGSLLHFGYYKGGEHFTEIYNEETCSLGQINQNSDLDLLRSNGFPPNYFDNKKKIIGKYKLSDLLGQLDNLKELRYVINKPSKGRK